MGAPLDNASVAPLPCIRCGECSRACPVGLLPQQLHAWIRLDEKLGVVIASRRPNTNGISGYFLVKEAGSWYRLITDAPPAMKTATVTNELKPATTETGLIVRVPAFIAVGEVVRVDTETGQYVSRAKE